MVPAPHEELNYNLIDDLVVQLALWNDAKRRETVLELVARIQRGEFFWSGRPPVLVIRVQFIIDDHLVLNGFSQLNCNGLLTAPGICSSCQPSQVRRGVTSLKTIERI